MDKKYETYKCIHIKNSWEQTNGMMTYKDKKVYQLCKGCTKQLKANEKELNQLCLKPN